MNAETIPGGICIPPDWESREFFSIPEAGTIIKKSNVTILRWARLGFLKLTQFSPGTFYISRAELERYMSGKLMEPRE